MAGPLAGIVVLDLSRALAGPYCSLMLGDAGAEIVKVEQPGRGDDSRAWGPPFLAGESSYYLSVNRNKRSITLNLKNKRAKEALRRLAARADVLLENFTPGTAARLGFSYEDVRKLNPAIIYCSISGFGQDGPGRDRAAYDIIVQGMSGWMSITGEPGGTPIRPGVPTADMTAGMFAAFAIMLALYRRQQTGAGAYVDTSLLEAHVALLGHQAGRYFATGVPPVATGNRHASIAPYESLKTADGHVNVAVGNDSLWQRFCSALGLEHLASDARFATNPDRLANRDALAAAIEARLADLSTARVVELLSEVGVPCGPIYNLHEVFSDPQAQHLGLRRLIDHPTIGKISQVPAPYRIDGAEPSAMTPPPLLGQHTEEILRELGYSEADIVAMRQEGAI